MPKYIALDLKAARRKAGLLQSDLAHLLNIDRSKVSLLESGKLWPSLPQITMLSLIYGKTIESLLTGLRDDVVNRLVAKLANMPPVALNRADTFNRAYTLSQLAIRLEAITRRADAGA